MRRGLLLAVAACSSTATRDPAPVAASAQEVSGQTPDGARVELTIADGKIGAVAAGTDSNQWLWPAIVDSHVHLAYYPVGERLTRHGVGAVVDLAAPEATLSVTPPLTVIASGPMITRPNGYPLNAWGDNGYGIPCDEIECVTAAIDRLAAAGAKVIKLPLDVGGLPRDFVPAAIEHAHDNGLRVAVHALTNEAAHRGGIAGADILAHTPVEPLEDETVAAWKGRAVISTLAAFGGQPSTLTNLRLLRAAGVTVLYGTDLGNLRVDGPAAEEVKLLRDAGLDDKDIVDAMTTGPIAYWRLPLALKQGDEATLLVLDQDPRIDAAVLIKPRTVIHRGRLMQ